ncbi:molybdopterin-synthase adenylyltransferase MoeB [Sungkyunkwania multivorans]|uniref:Molybdopterin-synthase adenylyltransferase MoeB n=1 Tax=Sungkyunkwania multivorans TaxID=1173618 RepID=A0ABW3D0T5_9FLAO
MNNRYSRHILLEEIGEQGQQRLNRAKVLVIGAGGLGCPVLQYLTGAGIGVLGIVDFDVVERSNLQRQVLFGEDVLGKNKALAAKDRLQDLNPEITINAYPEKLSPTNAISLFENYDIIIDGSDNFATRYLVNDACIITNRPFIYGAIYKFEGQVSVFNFKGGPSYRCLFPTPPKTGSVPNCSDIGVLGVLPGIIGSMQANEVIKMILGIGKVLSGKMLLYNTMTTQTSTFTIKRNDLEIAKVKRTANNFHIQNYELFCGNNSIKEISIFEALKKQDTLFVDVREAHEMPKVGIVSAINIPLQQLEEKLDDLDKEKEIILLCQTGVRSKKAAEILQKKGFGKVFNLRGGAVDLEKEPILKLANNGKKET